MEEKSKNIVKRARQLAKERGISFDYLPERGKGCHGLIMWGKKPVPILGKNKTVRGRTLYNILKQLDVSPDEFFGKFRNRKAS